MRKSLPNGEAAMSGKHTPVLTTFITPELTAY